MGIKISQLTTINGANVDDADLFPIVDVENNNTDKIELGTLKAYILNGISAAVYKSGTLIVDPVNGDDSTALPYRLDKTYATPAAALAAAVYGDTIELYPGVHYFFSNAAKDGVNYFAYEGADIYSFTTFLNYDLGAGGITLTAPSFFTGYGRILYCSGSLINIKNNPFNVTLEFNDVTVNNLSNAILAQDGTIYLKIRNNYTSAGRNFSCRLTGNIIADIGGNCTCTYVNTFNGVFWISGTSWSGKANIKAKGFAIPVNAVGGNSQHIYLDNLVGGVLNIELDELIDVSNVAQAAIQVSSAFTNTGGNISIKIKEATTNRPLYNINNSVANVILEVDKAFNANPSNVSAGNVLVKNTLHRNLLGKVVNVSGGTLSLMGTTLVSDGVAATISNSAGTVLSEGSKGNTAPANPVTGNFYVNPLYTL